MSKQARFKTHVPGHRPDVQVPFIEVALGSAEDHVDAVRLYDTSGPGSDPTSGLPPLRDPWIAERDDVEEYEGRRAALRDDGRAAVRRSADEPSGLVTPG